MSDFDFRLHKVIGVAKKKYDGALHANIYPLGYQDKNFHFQPFNKHELKELFPHNGTIFGYKFPDYLVDELIILQLRESEFVNDQTKDVFSADYDTKIIKYSHTSVLSANKQELKNNIEQGQYNKYFKVGSRIYHITKSDAQKGIAKYWIIEDGLFVANRNLCIHEDEIYLIRDNINYPCKYSDLLSREKIVNFVINVVEKFQVDHRDIAIISDELIQNVDLPLDILRFRFDVFNSLLPSITLTHRNILDLASNQILSEVVQRSIKEYEQEYIRTCEVQHYEQIKKMEQSEEQKLQIIRKKCEQEHETYLSQLESICEDIDTAKLRLKEIDERIKKKENEAKQIELRFADIEEHKERLIEDFSVVRDVLGSQISVSQQPLRSSIEYVSCDGESILEFDDFCNHIFVHLLYNRFSEDSAIEVSKNISRLFVAKNHIGRNLSVILLPNLKIFKSLINAIGQYRLCSIGVAPNWKSYDDLYFNVLDKMVISANNNPKDIHIILLQYINLSYIPSYMQPINDILIGISNKLPSNNDIACIPSNLWIFGTRTGFSEEAIPISKSNIEEYGCLENKEYTYCYDKIVETPEYKFITMDFVNKQREEERRYKSHPESYID